ncbi:hypothetical protein ABPG74_004583 [Tetrahymena malaccensis]
MQQQQAKNINKDDIKLFLKGKQSGFTSNQIELAINFLQKYGFQVIQLIDTGAFGVVMKAYESQNSLKILAIKLIIVTDADILKDNIQEYQKSLLIIHPCVIRNYQQLYDDENEFYFIISEFCQKGNLFNYFKQNSLTYEEILKICNQIIEGVIALHDKNIIHSDLKPQNILINSDNQIKICDFGMSKYLLSYIVAKRGSLDYMAPEQIQGILNKQCDIYAVGCIICFLLNLDIFELNLINIKKGIFPSIEDPSIKELASLAFKMMEVEPKNRISLQDCLLMLQKIQNKNANKSTNQNQVKQYLNGDIYQGQFKEDKKNGKGTYFYNESSDSKKYEGEWVNDKMEGFGVFEWRNGDRYEGYFKNGLRNGKGISFYNESSDSKKYEGEYVNDKMEGFGVFEWRNGDRYEGYFKNGLRNGNGISFYNESRGSKKYEGEWVNDKMEGFGVCEWSNGQRYEGYFKNNLKNGKGIFYFNESSRNKKYEGEYVNGKMEGFGVLEWRNGDRYEGYFKNGQKNGKGTSFYNESSGSQKYEGEWVNDKREGFGVCQWSNGQRYEGYFKNNLMNGKGIFYFNESSRNKKYEGEYVNGKMEGFGVLEWRNGDIYEGYFKNGNLNGKGKYYNKNGIKQEGMWVDNKIQN